MLNEVLSLAHNLGMGWSISQRWEGPLSPKLSTLILPCFALFYFAWRLTLKRMAVWERDTQAGGGGGAIQLWCETTGDLMNGSERAFIAEKKGDNFGRRGQQLGQSVLAVVSKLDDKEL